MLDAILKTMIDEAERDGQSIRLRKSLHILILNTADVFILILSGVRTYPSFEAWDAVVRNWPYYVRDIEPLMTLYEGRPSLRARLPKQGVQQTHLDSLFTPIHH